MRKALFFLGVLSDTDIEWIIRNGVKEHIPAGAVLIHEGKPTDSLFFVLDGEFIVSTRSALRVAALQAGEVLGEISFVDSRPPTATVTASRASLVGRIGRTELSAKLRQDTAFASRFYLALATFLADRLRTTTAGLGQEKLELDEEIEDVDELAPHLMDSISLAGSRFSEMQRRNWGV
ncbi:MAG: cyclic nucleotide-binding domain-containing protein [Terracidiphilus sp.]|jgi:CRP-like cAMP-binding protein